MSEMLVSGRFPLILSALHCSWFQGDDTVGIRTKFNLLLFAVLLPALLLSAVVSWSLLQKQAREEVIHSAELMTEAAQAIRKYTVEEIRPLINQEPHPEFLPQTVPAYAATAAIGRFSKEFSDFLYKEATLNPTNPRDRAVDWESDIIQEFKRDSELGFIDGERATPTGAMLYTARPIVITNAACLSCHSTADAAPESLIAKYGSANGFGWQMNEIVGAQIVSVPMSIASNRAMEAFGVFMALLAGVFALVFLVLNLALNRLIVAPMMSLASDAEKVSTGDFTVPEFSGERRDEIGALGIAFNRMRRSLEQAMKMMD